MASKAAKSLKKKWMKMSDDCFEPLTLGEINEGEKFIFLPEPGDNHNHGGLKGPKYIFFKAEKCTITGCKPQSFVVNTQTGNTSNFPDSIPVILLS